MNTRLSSRPIQVKYAIWLLYGQFGLSFVLSLVIFLGAMMQGAPVLTWMLTWLLPLFLAFLFLWWYHIFLVSRGYNWARILYLLLALASIPFSLSELLSWLSTKWVWALYGLGNMSMSVAALVLLFHPAASEWFRGRRAPSRPIARRQVELTLAWHEFMPLHESIPLALDNGDTRRSRR